MHKCHLCFFRTYTCRQKMFAPIVQFHQRPYILHSHLHLHLKVHSKQLCRTNARKMAGKLCSNDISNDAIEKRKGPLKDGWSWFFHVPSRWQPLCCLQPPKSVPSPPAFAPWCEFYEKCCDLLILSRHFFGGRVGKLKNNHHHHHHHHHHHQFFIFEPEKLPISNAFPVLRL